MNEEELSKVNKFFTEKVTKCICCESKNVFFDGRIMVTFPLDELNNFRDDKDCQLIRQIVQHCNDCGYVMYFLADKVLS